MKKSISLVLILAFALLLNAQNKEKNITQPKSVIFAESFETESIPNGWETIDGDCGWLVSTDGASSSFPIPSHTYYAYVSDDICNGNMSDVWMISPTIDCSGAFGNLELSFASYSITFADILTLKISIDDGITWTNISTYQTVTEWSEETIDLSSYAGESTVKIAFHYNDGGSWGCGWAIDDVQITEIESNDMAIIAAAPSVSIYGEDIVPTVDVKNMGTNLQDNFTIEIVINDGSSNVYISSKEISNANLASGDIISIAFDDVALLTYGEYTLTANVVLEGDSNPNNDTITQPLSVVKFSYINGYCYSYDAWTEKILYIPVNDGTMHIIADATTSDYFSCGEHIDSIVYGVEYNTNELYAINGDGFVIDMGKISGVDLDLILGMAYNGNSIYLLNYSTIFLTSSLYKLDLGSLSTIYVGDVGTYVVSGIACDAEGNLYGIDQTNDNFISINTQTGTGTVIGSLGFNIAYLQDIGSDRVNNIIYGTLYNGDNDLGGFYSIDINTGTANLINSFGTYYQLSLCAIVPEVATYSATFIVDDGINSIEGATVTLAGYGAQTTDASGTTVFDAVLPGTFDYEITATGYTAANGTILISNNNITENVTLEDDPTGLIEISANKLIIYPQPASASDYVNIKFLDNIKDIKVKIVDINGRLVKLEEVRSINSQIFRLNLNGIVRGIYSLQIEADKIYIIKKLIVQ